ncbi:hypothetical protein OPT61_g5311 [Boeremia exigua]|uniref:Uncharacterized protein n=1 Tax=Boeremia exigua TaxID=749465 RepID=A0ACC2IB30_9PLEO|nr:hypothetical protein OPT61_g5311 [Boeremia exigua]
MSANGLTEATLRGTGIGLMTVTTIVVGTRATLRTRERTRVRWHDGWLLLGYVLFMVVSGVYVANPGLMFRLLSVQEGRIAPYPDLAGDALHIQKTFFFTSPGLWFTLWSVKFALLAFYKKMMVNVSLYTKLWWAVSVYCVLTLVLSVVLHIAACPTPGAWFKAGACGSTPRDIRGSLISFWEAFAVDITSDIMIMLLPIGLIRNLQLPKAQKISVIALFGMGGLCMLASVLRVVQVGETTGGSNNQPSLTWLALWSIIESSIAVIVGCGPGIYRKVTSISRSRQTPYYNESQSKVSKGRGLNGTEGGLVPLHPIASNNIEPVDKTDSQEELEFYAALFPAWKFISDSPDSSVEAVQFIFEQPSGLSGGIVKRTEGCAKPSDQPMGIGYNVYFYVDSIDEIEKKIADIGGTKVLPKTPERDNGFFANFKDPEGNRFGVFEANWTN